MLDSTRWTPISEKHCRHICFSPIVFSKTSVLQHAPCTLHKRPIHTLRNSVELWCVRRRILEHNSLIRAELGHFCRRIFTAVVTAKRFYALAGLLFCERYKIGEFVDNFGLAFDQVDNAISGLVVDESHKVALAAKS